MEPLEQLGQSGEEALKQTSSLFTQMGEKFLDYLPTLVIGLAVFVLGVLLTRLISHVLSRTMRNSKIDETAKGFGQSLVRILLLTVLVIICLSILAGAIVTAPKLIQADSGRHDLKVPQAS